MTISIDVAVGDVSDIPKTPLMVECRDCVHRWAELYLPMNMAKAAKVLKAARCPMCGGNKIFTSPESRP